MSHRGGMQVSVQRALGFTRGRQPEPEQIVCGCGTVKVFDVNTIGQMVECCPRCRTERVYRAIRRFRTDDSSELA
jgi:hypothetical protein